MCERVKRKALAANCRAESRQICTVEHIFRALPRWRETRLEKFENRDVFRRETTIARHAARSPFEDRIIDRVCRRENDGRQRTGRLRSESTREHITQAEIKRLPRVK